MLFLNHSYKNGNIRIVSYQITYIKKGGANMTNIQKSINTYYDSIMKDINSSVRIISEGKEVKTYISKILTWKNTEISFYAPLVKGDYIRFLHNKTYPFVFVTQQCVYMTTVKIINFSKDENNNFYYIATIVDSLERNQQRNHFRLEWVENFKYQIGESTEWEKAASLDISAGGLRMTSKKKIELHAQIHIDITLLDTNLHLYGIVLEELGKNTADLYVYRVQFHNISSNTENLIAQLIMKRQRDVLKRV